MHKFVLVIIIMVGLSFVSALATMNLWS
jgi:hypothetical protein